MSIHIIGAAGLVVIFVIGTLRPVNLGVLALGMTFLVGTFAAREDARAMFSGFPADLFVLLAGVTYLFAVASNNGTVSTIVDRTTALFRNRRALIPWAMFLVASLPAMAGALGSAGVALLAPIALRLARRYDIDVRMVGLMVIYGAGAGNFSPLNVLGALVAQATARAGLQISTAALFVANAGFNLAVAAVAYFLFGGLQLGRPSEHGGISADDLQSRPAWQVDRVCTVIALLAVALAALVFKLNVGLLAFVAAAALQLAFPKSTGQPEGKVAWGVVLLVCGIVTYVAALQRYGTVDAIGNSLAQLPSALLAALLLCFVGGITSAFASSAGIIGAMIPLAAPFMLRGAVDATGMTIALALSATIVDATPFSTVGALVVANSEEHERPRVYRGLLQWGGAMVLIAPIVTWLIFVVITA
jgi:di/tricarboxylate transporter